MSFNFRIRTRVTAAAAVALAFAASAPAGAQTLPPAQQLVDRYVEAVGGAAARQHQFRRTEMEMSASGMTMTMEMLQARPNLTVTRMSIPGMGTMRTGFDGTVAWAMDPMQGARILTDDELTQTMRQAEFDASFDLKRLFPTMETVERTEMGGRACYLVRMVPETGEEVFNCFDAETGLLVGARAAQVSPMGRMEATMVFEEYRDFGGIKMPTVTRTQVMGQEMVLRVTNVSHDPIDASEFELPAQVRALVQ